MRILFALVSLPFPPNIGQRMRNYSLLRALKMEGHEVSILAFGDREEWTSARAGLAGLCVDLDIVPQPEGVGRVGYFGRFRALFSSLPYGAWRMRSHAMAERVRSCLAREHYDLLICDDIYQMENVSTISDLPVILNKHTIVFEEFERFLKHEGNPLVYAYGKLEAARLRRLENASVRQVAAVWPCSERDRRVLLGEDSGVTSTIIPNAIDLESFSPATGDDGRTLLYVGAMDWLPNRDAVEFFVFKYCLNCTA
jgi:glycosyltransferase involved in cell wall biosynthesis